ncbi:MAG: carbohydrate kinase family protein [Gemmatimonadaceae bacterium]|nr:carbohydrate kinase family protein [Gemmatimonadaceae bacterium]
MTIGRRRIGVIGTLVCDEIYGPPPQRAYSEGWGGITYALSGLDAALPPTWEIVPLIKVGRDVAGDAQRFMQTLPRLAPEADLREVPEQNNRSLLTYYSADERTEQMAGGVPAWQWHELEPVLAQARLDALYVNFLSGWELDLPTMQRVRAAVSGPIYIDVHMKLWVPDASGRRSLTPLADAAQWCGCCDYLQVNEEEMLMLSPSADALAQMALGAGARSVFVTMGPRGVRYAERGARYAARNDQTASAAITLDIVPTSPIEHGVPTDPTGCGDVWGATAFSRLLAGEQLSDALRSAHAAARVNAMSHGVDGLAARLTAARVAAS